MSAKIQLHTDNKTKFKKPSLYNVVMHNDDYTSMQFVVELLIGVFHKSSVDASNLMMCIHQKGKAIVGTYTYDISMTKKLICDNLSKENEFPLKITIEEAIQ